MLVSLFIIIAVSIGIMVAGYHLFIVSIDKSVDEKNNEMIPALILFFIAQLWLFVTGYILWRYAMPRCYKIGCHECICGIDKDCYYRDDWYSRNDSYKMKYFVAYYASKYDLNIGNDIYWLLVKYMSRRPEREKIIYHTPMQRAVAAWVHGGRTPEYNYWELQRDLDETAPDYDKVYHRYDYDNKRHLYGKYSGAWECIIVTQMI